MNKLIKFSRAIVTIIILLGVWLSTHAHDFEVDGIYYRITNSTIKTVAVTYKGNYGYEGSYNEYINSVTIPSSVNYNSATYSVTSIDSDAFYNCSELTFVSIPKSIISIGDDAFRNCPKLETFLFEDINNIQYVGYNPFIGTGWFNNQPDGLIYFDKIFLGYKGMKPEGAVEITDGTLIVAGGVFVECPNIKSIKLPSSILSIGNYAFSGCTNLISVNISDSVKILSQEGTFSGCSNLTSINIPTGNGYPNSFPEDIGSSLWFDMFEDCYNLQEITLGKDITHIYGSLEGCPNLSKITLKSLTPPSCNENPFINKSINIHVPYTSIDDYRNDSFWAQFDNIIGLYNHFKKDGIYYYINNDTEVGIGRIDVNKYDYSGDITIPEKINYNGNSYTVTSICDNSFRGCENITSLHLPYTIKYLDNYEFQNCRGLEAIHLPDSLISIGSYAFENCSIKDLNIPTTLSKVSVNGFSGFNVTNVHITDLSAWCNVRYYNNYPSSLSSICKNIYLNNVLIEGELTIPEGTSIIGEGAFLEYKKISAIKLNNDLTQIYRSAFRDIDKVTKLSIPKNVVHVSPYAFGYMDMLTWLSIDAINCNFVAESYYDEFHPFCDSKNIQYITIGDSVNFVSKHLIRGKAIVSLNKIPPTSDYQGAGPINSTILYVPKGCYAAYWSAPVWQHFKHIKEIECPAEALSLPKSLDIALNSTTPLTATLSPTNTTITNLFWESSNPEIATVDQDGNVTAVANGKAIITAYTIDGSKRSASCEVKIGIKEVESITINQTSAELRPNEMLNLSCSILPDDATNKSYNWSSSNLAVAVVRTNSDGSATVLAVSPGTTNITATTNDGTNLSASCEIKVIQLVESISLNKTTETINTGSSLTLTATVVPTNADYKFSSWTISDENLATIKDNKDGTATITAINPGVVTVTATTTDGTNLAASCEITINQLAQSIVITPNVASIKEGESIILTAIVLPQNTTNKTISWATNDSSIASVIDNYDGTATINLLKAGNVAVFASTTDGSNLAASCNINGISSISSIKTSNAAEIARYDIYGHKLDKPTKGINIIKYSDGTTRKEIVK